MPDSNRRSLRRFGPVGALGIVCLACFAWLVLVGSAAGAPAPDPPPLEVAPDPQPSKPAVAPPRRPREAPVVARAPVVQSGTPAPVVTAPPAPVEQPTARKPVRGAAPKPAKKKRPAAHKPRPVASPASVVAPAPREPWPALARTAKPIHAAEVLERRRYALAGVVLALVAVGGGVLVGVGGRTLREGLA